MNRVVLAFFATFLIGAFACGDDGGPDGSDPTRDGGDEGAAGSKGQKPKPSPDAGGIFGLVLDGGSARDGGAGGNGDAGGMSADAATNDAAARDAATSDAAPGDAATGDGSTSDECVNADEMCNGIDDDCDDHTDEGFALGSTCTTGSGACMSTGVLACNGAGTGTTCDATPPEGPPEICGDGIDQDCVPGDAVCPANDRPNGAINISAGGTFSGDVSAAHDDDSPSADCGAVGGRDIYFTFTLAAPSVIYADTFGSDFDTVVRVTTGTCAALGPNVLCNDNALGCGGAEASQVLGQLNAGTYCLIVDQWDRDQTKGHVQLNFQRAPRTGTPLAFSSSWAMVTGTTCGGTDMSQPQCSSDSTAPDTAFYFPLCPAETRTLVATTCPTDPAWDTVLYVRKAGTTDDLACNDDENSASCDVGSTLSEIPLTGPGLFYVIVDGYEAECGAFRLDYIL